MKTREVASLFVFITITLFLIGFNNQSAMDAENAAAQENPVVMEVIK